jgi:hypothetical protein
MITRRQALKTTPALAAGAVAACTTTGGVDMEAITKAIKQVQDAVAQACKSVGDLVPEADSVWLLLASLMGVSATNPVMVTIASVEQAIKLITDNACPTTPTATTKPAVAGGSVNVHGVDVHFIPLKK